MVVSYRRFETTKRFHLRWWGKRPLFSDNWTLVNRTDILSRNVGKELSFCATWNPNIVQISFTARRKPETTQLDTCENFCFPVSLLLQLLHFRHQGSWKGESLIGKNSNWVELLGFCVGACVRACLWGWGVLQSHKRAQWHVSYISQIKKQIENVQKIE
jgi:hypothetical protein